jgi:chromosome segregation ATPase
VNYYAPALREAVRIYDRQINRISLIIARRNLAKAEYDLGLLGWQQADFEGEAKAHVEELTNVEREQAKLTNDSAEVARAILGLQEQRAAEKQQYEEIRARSAATHEKATASVEETERHIAARRKNQVDFDGVIADLQRELSEAQALYSRLLVTDPQTPQVHSELLRLRGRTVEIPNAIDDLRTKGVLAKNDIRSLEERLARRRPILAAAEEELRKIDADFEKADSLLERQIVARERRKQTIGEQIEALESAKGNPYRQIGQILADHEIAPMNQPQSLASVKRCRSVIIRLAGDIATSLEASGSEDRAAMQKSWLVWGATMIALIALVLLALPH